VESAPVASAKYSRRREIASCKSVAAIGAKITATIARIFSHGGLSSSLPPKKEICQNISAIIEIIPTNANAMVFTRIS
jgi:hypothetical protein